MAGEPTITLVGRLGNDPEIHFTQTGRAVANFSVAVTPKTKDGDTWIDKDTLWFRVSLWRNAEAAVNELEKGDLVTISGKFANNTYTTKDGDTKTSLEIDADNVGLIFTEKKTKDEIPW
jgi:single-strand DNA-binding protein